MVTYPEVNVADAEWIGEDEFEPRYNIAPRSNAPVIRRRDPERNDLVIHTMKWGVIPQWNKQDDGKLNTINARAENLKESGGMWAGMKTKQRCVVVCDGYFEWLKKGKERLPHFIRYTDERLMILAGLYEMTVLEGATSPIYTFTIVTTDAASSLSWLHNRQPVILSTNERLEAWLDTSKGWHKGLHEILLPNDGKQLECYPVPKEVGRVGTNSSDFVKPIAQRTGGIEALFAKRRAKSTPQTNSNETSPSKSIEEGSTLKRPIDVGSPPPMSPGKSPSKKQKVKLDTGTKRRLTDNSDNQDDAAESKKQKMDESHSSNGNSEKSDGFRKKKKVKASSASPSKLVKPNDDQKITSFFRQS